MSKPTFKPSVDDRSSSLWKRLMTHLEGRLETLRQQNDAASSEAETARLRGQIAAVKEMLALNNEPPEL